MGELKERFLSVYNNAVHRDGSDMLLRWLEDSDFFVDQHPQSSTAAMKVGFFSIP